MKKLLLAAGLVAFASSAAADGSDYRYLQLVSPGQSIQAAIDRAAEGGWILVLPGTYRETADATNGLNITRGVNLVGLSTPRKKVVLENSGSQRNGIVAVPAAHTDCMSCHASMAPPFELLPGVDPSPLSTEPTIYGLSISGITIQNFSNNGLFTRNVDGFKFIDVHSVGNRNYGIFPTASKNGLIAHSSATGANDSGIWVETSELVAVTHNLVEGNVNGFEVSNSEEILLANNEARGNTVGMAILFLPDIFDERPDSRRITVRNNHVHDNNKPNTARPGSILSTVPSGTGILYLGVDDSVISKNVVRNHDFVGIGVVDYCAVVAGGPFDCLVDPDITLGFLLDNAASNNQVIENVVVENGVDVDPGNPFAFAASDLALITDGDNRNCYQDNIFGTFFSTLGVLPPCR
ncbi:MAG TPA: right-handed parallel beta-helix repeat-containing protein [Myxococcota bacterium]